MLLIAVEQARQSAAMSEKGGRYYLRRSGCRLCLAETMGIN